MSSRCKGIKTVENYKGIRIEYAGIGFISAFDNMLFDGSLEDTSVDTAIKAERAYDELTQMLPVPKCLKGGRTGLISLFTKEGYEKYRPLIENIIPIFEGTTKTEELLLWIKKTKSKRHITRRRKS